MSEMDKKEYLDKVTLFEGTFKMCGVATLLCVVIFWECRLMITTIIFLVLIRINVNRKKK